MGKKRAAEVTEEPEVDEEALLAEKKAKKKAKKQAAEAAAEEAVQEEDPAAKKAAKKAKKAAAAAAAETAEAEEDDEATALEKKKAAKKAKKAAAAAAAAAEEAEAEEEDPEAAKARRKAEKKAKKAAAAAAEAEVEQEEEPVKKKKKAAEEEEEAEEKPAKKAKKADAEEEEEAGGEENGKGKSKGKTFDNENTVFVRGLPYATTQEALEKDFGECGSIQSCKMPYNDEGQCKGVAFIKYASKEACDKAIGFNATDYGGRMIYVCMADERDQGKGKDGKGKGKDGKGKKGFDNENTVCIRGLPWASTEEALRKDFGECGEIESLRLPLNEEGKPRGTAFIKYPSKEACDKAIAFNETDYGGRTIYVGMAGEGGKGKDGKGKGKDGKGKDGKGKGKKGKKGKAPSESFAKSTGAMVESTGKKTAFEDDSDDE